MTFVEWLNHLLGIKPQPKPARRENLASPIAMHKARRQAEELARDLEAKQRELEAARTLLRARGWLKDEDKP